MSDQQPVCQLCGEPMPPGEDMFYYHGYSGPCPAPPKQMAAQLSAQPGPVGAEPIAWYSCNSFGPPFSIFWGPEKPQEHEDAKPLDLRPLYASPPAPELAAADAEKESVSAFSKYFRKGKYQYGESAKQNAQGWFTAGYLEALRSFFKSSRSAQVGMVSVPKDALETLVETAAVVGERARTRYNWAKAIVIAALSTTHGGER